MLSSPPARQLLASVSPGGDNYVRASRYGYLIQRSCEGARLLDHWYAMRRWARIGNNAAYIHACDPTCAPARSTAECVGRRTAPDAVRACATLGQLRQVSNEPERPRAESRARVPLARALAHPSYWERPARSLPRRQGMRAAFATHTQDGRRAVRRRGLWAAHSAVVRKGDRDALLRVWDCLCIPKAAY